MMVSSEDIALVASKTRKKKIDPKHEKDLIEKSKKSKCRCHHLKLLGNMCMYRTCRHNLDTHNRKALAQ